LTGTHPAAGTVVPPRLAITMGDPAGIGPEVALKAIVALSSQMSFTPILVGDPEVFRATARRLRLRRQLKEIEIELCDAAVVPESAREPGAPVSKAARAACGAAAFDSILAGVQLVEQGIADGLVTAPISKAHLAAAGRDFPGHTELLAELAGGVPVRMMLAGPQLRVVLATIHVRLAEVPQRLSVAGLVETFQITAAALREQLGLAEPRIAVAGLNPHAGEGGLFGDEEIRLITPAIRSARRRGWRVEGPFAADGLFAHAASGAYDAIVCMYHDQGLGPFKLLHFADGVNVTLGLPYVRTSPDHGTAFDIAGSGKADARSMCAAIRFAVEAASRTAAPIGECVGADG